MDLDQIKQANPIQEIIGETHPLRGWGRWLRGQKNSSLVVDLHRQTFYWNSRDRWGDVVQWVMEQRKLDFKNAVEWLCDRARLPRPEWKQQDAQAAIAARQRADVLTVACRHWVRCLRQSDEAQAYARGRGWTDKTINRAGLGYVDGDTKALRGELQMHGIDLHSPAAQAVLKAPRGLVYTHVYQGRVTYVATRSIEDKHHWNPDSDLIGPRQPYFNHEYAPMTDLIVLVEGQADAVTLAQWGIAAVALAGCSASPELVQQIKRHHIVIVGLDDDEAGRANTAKLADALGPLTRIVIWPANDANAWLQDAAAEASDAQALLSDASIWIEDVAHRVGALPEIERADALDELIQLAARLEPAALAVFRQRLAKAAQLGQAQFDQLVRAAIEARQTSDETDEPQDRFHAIGGTMGDHLLETLYIPPDNPSAMYAMSLESGKSQFAVRGPDEIKTVDYFDWDKKRYYPIMSATAMMREQSVRFASRVGESLPVPELVNRVKTLIHKYVDVNEFYENLASYYVLFTWVYDVFDTLPYLRIKGDTGTGKSRFLQVAGSLCFRPMLMNAGASISSIFRTMHQFRGTLVLDEADFQASDESSAIAKILNVGYQRRQGYIYRSGDRNNNFETEMYLVFGPKVIATRKNYDDRAIESRCLTYEMIGPTMRNDVPKNLPNEFWDAELPALQALLLRFRFDTWSPDLNRREIIEDYTIEPRLQQIISPLLKMVDDPDVTAGLQEFLQQYNQQMISERGMTIAAKLLEALYILQHTQRDTPSDEQDFSMATIAEIANDLMDYENGRPVEKWARFNQRSMQQITARGAGEEARNSLGLHTKPRVKKRRRQIIWDNERIKALWQRYGLGTDEDQAALMQLYQDIQDAIAQHYGKDKELTPPPDHDLVENELEDLF